MKDNMETLLNKNSTIYSLTKQSKKISLMTYSIIVQTVQIIIPKINMINSEKIMMINIINSETIMIINTKVIIHLIQTIMLLTIQVIAL